MIFKILLLLGLSSLSAFLYRRGGTNKGTLWRDVGCSLVTLVALWLLLGFKLSYWWAYLLTFGLSWGALASYWCLDEKKWGYWAHGLGLSLAVLPFAYITGQWLGFALRTIVLTALITVWSELVGDVNWEEGGRGFLIIFTIPLILI